jgi:hypothetical protein
MTTNQNARLLTLLLQNSVIANFEYWSEFILRIQRDEAARHPALTEMFGGIRIPPLFCLRLRGIWRIGRLQEWNVAVQEFPIKGTPPVAVEAPLQASLLMTKLSEVISEVGVGEGGELTLELSDRSSIVIEGIGGGWDESWILELPVDDPDRDQWQIVCESQGLIGGKFPGA